jgi:hypothetical protein
MGLSVYGVGGVEGTKWKISEMMKRTIKIKKRILAIWVAVLEMSLKPHNPAMTATIKKIIAQVNIQIFLVIFFYRRRS